MSVNTVHDPMYTILNQSVAISQDTVCKQTHKISALVNGKSMATNPLTAPLNVTGNVTEFNYSNGSNYKSRFDTTRLNIYGSFTAMADATTALNCSPPWNLAAQLIRQISLSFNGSGKAIYSKTQAGHFKACFTSRLLRHYTIDQLEKMSDFLFTPIQGDKYYLHTYANGYEYDMKGHVLPMHDAAAGNTHARALYTAPAEGVDEAWTLENAEATEAFWGANQSNMAGGAAERQRKYIGEDSQLRTQCISIPFADLFPRFQGIPKNLRSVQVKIMWEDYTNIHLEYAGSASDGTFKVTKCEIVTDDYVMSTGQSVEAVQEKAAAVPDNIAFFDTDIKPIYWNAGDIILPSQKNIDAVMLLQFADEVKNEAAGSRYMSSGQFLLCNGLTDDATVWRQSSDMIQAATHVNPSKIQIEYNGINYPTDSINLLNGYHFDSSELYFEYLKAFGKVGDRLNGPPMPYDLFCSTMPFIYLKPFSNEAVKLSPSANLIIKMTGSSDNVSDATTSGFLWLICFKPRLFVVNADSTINEQSL